MLETLGRHVLLPGKAAESLTNDYKTLRAAYHRSALQDQPTTIPEDQLGEQRDRVQSLWRELMED